MECLIQPLINVYVKSTPYFGALIPMTCKMELNQDKHQGKRLDRLYFSSPTNKSGWPTHLIKDKDSSIVASYFIDVGHGLPLKSNAL